MSVGDDLRSIYEEHGIVTVDIVRDSSLNLERVEEEYGSLNEALREEWGSNDQHLREKFLDTIETMAVYRDEKPTMGEFVEYTRWSEQDVRAEFGTRWDDVVSDLDVNYDQSVYDVSGEEEGVPVWIRKRMEQYGPNWFDQRQEVLDRDGLQCRACDVGDDEVGLHVHHIRPKKEFVDGDELDYMGANRMSNLVTLCPTCHTMFEGQWRSASAEEFVENARKHTFHMRDDDE